MKVVSLVAGTSFMIKECNKYARASRSLRSLRYSRAEQPRNLLDRAQIVTMNKE